MTVFNAQDGQSAVSSYDLRISCGAAALVARKILPPVIADIVVAEMTWWKESTWTANHERLRLVIAEIQILAELQERAA